MSVATGIVDTYMGAWDSHDLDMIASVFNEGGSYSDPVAGRLVGGAAYAQNLLNAFPDIALETISNVQAGNGLIATLWLMMGTHKGQLLKYAATGKKMTLAGCDFITVSNGKIDTIIGLFDPNSLLSQLGLSS